VKNLSPCASTSFSGSAENAYIARSASSGACGCDNVTTTVLGSGAVIDLTAVIKNPQPPSNFFARLMEYATSLAVTGEPSENLAERNLNV